MLIRRKPDLTEADVTDPKIYRQRRAFLKTVAGGGTWIACGFGMAGCSDTPPREAAAQSVTTPLDAKANPAYAADGVPTAKDAFTSYVNYYEFGTDKRSPVKNAQALTIDPWSVEIEGECHKPGVYTLEDILKPHPLEERIYRFRCVETWSAVVPWVGFPLGDLLKRFEPKDNAKYVQFQTAFRPDEMPGLARPVLDWPYVEGLRMDEAMHPLTLASTGIYGETLPKQNGAPIRLVVPWKYGFKSIKSIVKIRFSESMPDTAWSKAVPSEYGFYANVNPEVPHPRWSQAREQRLGEFEKRPTEKFNGYGEQVASLYTGMDLSKFY